RRPRSRDTRGRAERHDHAGGRAPAGSAAGVSSAVLIRRLRLLSGLVLLAYLATHFANHALGLVSLDAMEEGRQWFLRLWRNPLGTAALYAALVIHVLLALRSLYRKRTLRMPAWEAAQLTLGLAIPPLLVFHIVGTRLAHTLYEVTDSYARTVLTLWHQNPSAGWRQALLLRGAWDPGGARLPLLGRPGPPYPPGAPPLVAGGTRLP